MPTYVYVSCAGTREILAYRMDSESGRLTPLPGARITAEGGGIAISMPLAVSPDRRFLYAAVRTPPFAVAAFAIEPATGRLDSVGTTPLPASMSALAVTADRRHLLAVSFPSGLLSSSRIAGTGLVETPPVQIVPDLPEAHGLLLEPTNRFAYAAVLGGDAIAQFRFDVGTGVVEPNNPPAVTSEAFAGPRHLAMHPTLPLFYCLNERSGTVDVLRMDEERGILAPFQTVGSQSEEDERRWRVRKAERGRSHPPPGSLFDPRTAGAADIHLTPDGTRLYVSLRTSSQLVGFAVDACTGALRNLGAWATESCPRSFAIDREGRFLLAAGQVTAKLTVFGIDRNTGALTKSEIHDTSSSPNWVEIVDLPALGETESS